MLGKIKTKIEFKPKTHCINIDVEGVIGKTFVVESNGNYKRWKEVKVGDYLSGLEWFDEEGKIIDADSKIVVLR